MTGLHLRKSVRTWNQIHSIIQFFEIDVQNRNESFLAQRAFSWISNFFAYTIMLCYQAKLAHKIPKMKEKINMAFSYFIYWFKHYIY